MQQIVSYVHTSCVPEADAQHLFRISIVEFFTGCIHTPHTLLYQFCFTHQRRACLLYKCNDCGNTACDF